MLARSRQHLRPGKRLFHDKSANEEKNNRVVIYAASVAIGTLGAAYAAVPLYKAFCQATGFGGTTQRQEDMEKVKTMQPVDGARSLKVSFNCDVSDMMPWKFRPQQKEVKLVPGETALAFYTAENKSDKAITGVATYNVNPSKAGLYFNKVQCFCFEQQRLKPKEQVDMPVFFYIDPEFLDDPAMDGVNTITLSYTFFKTEEDEDFDDDYLEEIELKNAKPSADADVTSLAGELAQLRATEATLANDDNGLHALRCRKHDIKQRLKQMSLS